MENGNLTRLSKTLESHVTLNAIWGCRAMGQRATTLMAVKKGRHLENTKV